MSTTQPHQTTSDINKSAAGLVPENMLAAEEASPENALPVTGQDKMEGEKPESASVSLMLDESDDVEDVLEPGVYPQDDGKVKIVLSRPLKRKDSEETIKDVMIIRELSASEQDKAGGVSMLGMMQNSAYSKIVNKVTDPMITPQTFLALPARDRVSLMQGILLFFT